MATYSNLYIDQGSDFNATIDLSQATGSLDLTDFTTAGTIAKSYDGTSKGSFTAEVDDTNNELDISLTAAETAALKPGRYVYDVIIKSPAGVITRVLEGQLEVTPGVTFDAIAPETTGGAGNVNSSESSGSGSSSSSGSGSSSSSGDYGTKTEFVFTNSGDDDTDDRYAFIELDTTSGVLPYHVNTSNTSSITLSVRLAKTKNGDSGDIYFFLATQTFVENHRHRKIESATNLHTGDEHGFRSLTSSPIQQGPNAGFKVLLKADQDVGDFKYLVIAFNDGPNSHLHTPGNLEVKFELSELEITDSTHPEGVEIFFKEPKQLINTFPDEATHYTDTSTVGLRKFESISSTTGLFKS